MEITLINLDCFVPRNDDELRDYFGQWAFVSCNYGTNWRGAYVAKAGAGSSAVSI
jgi:hypothetical protein